MVDIEIGGLAAVVRHADGLFRSQDNRLAWFELYWTALALYTCVRRPLHGVAQLKVMAWLVFSTVLKKRRTV